MNIDLGQYGSLDHQGDHYFGPGLRSEIGPVDAQVDGVDIPAAMQAHIAAVLDKIKELDAEARAYLDAHAAQDVEVSGGLIEPSLLFRPEDEVGSFVLFYSGAREDDEMCYGVDFRDFRPFDLTIGD